MMLDVLRRLRWRRARRLLMVAEALLVQTTLLLQCRHQVHHCSRRHVLSHHHTRYQLHHPGYRLDLHHHKPDTAVLKDSCLQDLTILHQQDFHLQELQCHFPQAFNKGQCCAIDEFGAFPVSEKRADMFDFVLDEGLRTLYITKYTSYMETLGQTIEAERFAIQRERDGNVAF